MNTYTIIAGVNGTGKSSFRGVLLGQGTNLGCIIDPDLIAKKTNNDLFNSGKIAVEKINSCIEKRVSFTQETTLGGRSVLQTVRKARCAGYNIVLYYIGLNTSDESLFRIERRVKKGGHNIPKEDVIRRFNNRFKTLKELIPYCDKVIFYDNENGFENIATITNSIFQQLGDCTPEWLIDLKKELNF